MRKRTPTEAKKEDDFFKKFFRSIYSWFKLFSFKKALLHNLRLNY